MILNTMVLKDGAVLDPGLRKELDTCHPTLFMTGDGKNAAWIEGLHRRDSEYAYHVRYLSPNVLDNRPEDRAEFESYRDKIGLVMDQCDHIAAVDAT